MKYIKIYEKFIDVDANHQIQLDHQLAVAVHQNNPGMVKTSLEAGADPNKKDYFKGDFLSVAITNNNMSIIKNLLKYGADPNIQGRFGYTPLITAARDRFTKNKVRTGWENDEYYENVLEELIMAGADWNIKDDDGEDFFDFLIDYFRQPLIDKYPEQYKVYKMKKEEEKYNL